MSGKSYTMREMNSIVDYLIKNKFYGEIRGRKMWMDFANSQLTTRSWQSLKETFLKRILPDIHNPYYGLSTEQINSFRAGYDVADRNKNKLEIHTISDDSNSNENNQKDNEQPNNGNSNEGETTAGEIVKCSKINPQRNRSSADTIILDNCYETAEDIQKELESNGDKEKDEKPFVNKSLRDCITYSEPLTPMLQEVLDDFASEPDDSDRESRMEIVDSVPDNDNMEENSHNPGPENNSNTKSVATDVAKNAKGLSAEVVEEVLAQELDGSSKPEHKSPKKKTPTTEVEEIPVINLDEEISSMQAETGTEKDNDHSETVETTKIDRKASEKSENPVANISDNTKVSVVNETENKRQSGGLNHSNSTVDSSLPNNPEALKTKQPENTVDKNSETHVNTEEISQSNKSNNIQSPMKNTRKRSMSVDTVKNMENKKKKFDIKLKLPKKNDTKPIIESPAVKKDDHKVSLSLKKDNKKTTESCPAKEDKNCENEDLETNKIEEHSKVGEDKVGKADEVSHKPAIMIKQQVVKTPIEFTKPSTSVANDVGHKIGSARSSIKNPAEINPCLQNVSLYDEQFNKAKYNMSESSDTEQNKKETKVTKQEGTSTKAPDETVVLKSESESEVEQRQSSLKKKTRAGVLTSKSERDKAIANMFGFTSGGVGSKRRRQLSRRRRTISHNNAAHNTVVSNSSEWTSAETESDTFVSPPRGRKNRQTKKYLKPKSAKILSLEEEGGLFVMYGKKIYPLVKDGKIVKNYLTYLPESDSDEGESYWKQKYVEEKKRAEEFKKLLEKSKEPPRSRDSHSPILQANPSRKSRSSHNQPSESSHETSKDLCIPERNTKKEEIKTIPPEKISIKFTKNNEEVHLEGHWPQIHPVLEQVVQIFHKEAEPTVSEAKSKMILEPQQPKELSSGNSTPIIITPVDPEVHEKVNQIETEIFKEIEERDREEQTKPDEMETNVTKRKAGRPRKSSSSVSQSPVKRLRLSVSETKESEDTSTNKRKSGTENKAADNKDISPRRLTRTPRKVLNETAPTNDSKQIQTRRSKQNLDTSKDNKTNVDEEVRYMLPPTNKRQSLRAPANAKTSQKPRKSSAKVPKIYSSPDNLSLNSLESTQGYQDSDVSPLKTELRKKKKMDISSFTIKTRNSLRRSTRRKSHPYVFCDAYNDSSNSSVDGSVKIIARENSSLNTEAYRSESYQLLMPQAPNSFRPLQPIDETCPIGDESNFVRNLESMSKNENSHNDCNSQSGQITSDVGSSSNVSLPLSPELSVVENMSISKDLLNSIEDYPTLNELQSDEVKEQTMCRKYMISDVDVSVPLMQQDCELESCNGAIDVSNDPKSLVTESLLKKIDTFNINDNVTATDSLDKKLHDMLLESAKKITGAVSTQNKESVMDVDGTDGSKLEVQKKAKSKKRCSTPRKRKTSQKSVAPKVEPLVEEEHVESYSHSGRKSCPPLLQTFQCNGINEEINIANLTIEEKPKTKKKKNIIKVKIQRPQAKISKKSSDKHSNKKSAQNESTMSVFSDSGINETESEVFLRMNDSVDLIHNHTETCLQANECVGDSIEFVENSKSVITLGDSMQSGDNTWHNPFECFDTENTSPDLFCNNAQDMKSFYNKTSMDNIEDSSDTVYHSPLGTDANNSLITEDLSDDPPQPPARHTKWYLLSEDETNNTNMVGQGSTMLNAGSFGSNLKQLFPIACAVPDLSTISELSRENEDSRKPMLDINGLTGDDFNSQSIFDSNL